MYLLYLDESGHPHDPNSQFFVLAGFSIFERQTHWLDQAIEPIAARFNATESKLVEFHGGPMRTGKDGWFEIPPADRVQAVVDIFECIKDASGKSSIAINLFAVVIEKSLIRPDQLLERAFEIVSSEFDKQLGRLFLRKNPQRGLIILDRSSYELQIQSLSNTYKTVGHTNGKLRNLAETPLFLDSKASRLIQAADLIAYWTFRRYQALDDRGFKIIEPLFCRINGQVSGLVEIITEETRNRIAAIPAHAHPFPLASGKASAPNTGTQKRLDPAE